MNKIILWFLPLIFSTKLLLGASPSENKKVILIIDSFQGMGKDIAQALEKSDQYIIYVATQHSNESFLMQNIGIRNDNLYFKPVDITKENEAQRLIHEILQREKRIDILINTIGKGLFGCAETVKIEQAKEIFEINFFGIVRMIQLVLPTMRQNKKGLIINMSTMVSIEPSPCWDFYNATKFALEGLSASMAPILSHWNIHLVLIESGFLSPPFLKNSLKGEEQLDQKNHPYQIFMDNIWKNNEKSFESTESNQDISNLIKHIIENPEPNFRYQTTPYIRNIAQKLWVDPTGNENLQKQEEFLEKMWNP